MKQNEATKRLDELLEGIARDGAAPRTWIVEHTAHGDLSPIWDACESAATLLRLYARTGDRAGLVLAACTCARMAVSHVALSDPRPLRAIEAAEAWARGVATLDEVKRAAEGAWLATGRLGPNDDRTMAGEPAAGAAFFAALSVNERDAVVFVACDAERALSGQGEADAGRVKLAMAVRSQLTCPKIESLH